jgi:hypothetical protein
MGVRCPKCGNTDEATMWEDNFWSGCNKCKWSASCENAIWVRDPRQPGVLVDARYASPYRNYRDDEDE